MLPESFRESSKIELTTSNMDMRDNITNHLRHKRLLFWLNFVQFFKVESEDRIVRFLSFLLVREQNYNP